MMILYIHDRQLSLITSPVLMHIFYQNLQYNTYSIIGSLHPFCIFPSFECLKSQAPGLVGCTVLHDDLSTVDQGGH